LNQIEKVLNSNGFELNSDYLKCMDCVDMFFRQPNRGLGGRFFEITLKTFLFLEILINLNKEIFCKKLHRHFAFANT